MAKHRKNRARDYVLSKVAHMQRMGIAASVNEYGAAEPDWHREQRQENDKRIIASRARNR